MPPHPQPKVRRTTGRAQDRLVSELDGSRLRLIRQRCVARFMADYNRRYAAVPAKCKPRRPPLHKSDCCLYQRIVSNDTSCSGTAALPDPQQGQRFSFAGAKVHIYQALDGRVSLDTAKPACTHWLRQGDIFTLPLG